MQPIQIPPCKNPKVAQPLQPFRHMTRIQTRFNDFDMIGHLNNCIYLQFMDIAKVSYFETALGHKIDMHGPGVVVVNVNINFHSPAYMEEPLAVLTSCIKLSRRSFTLEQRVVNPETGDVKSVATTVMASFDAATATSPELPEEWAKSLAQFESL